MNDLFEGTGVTRHEMSEVVRLLGEGKVWDALEILRRATADGEMKRDIDMAQFRVELPW